jgi:hypothetical protein
VKSFECAVYAAYRPCTPIFFDLNNNLPEFAGRNTSTVSRQTRANLGPVTPTLQGRPLKDIDLAALQIACRNLARGTLWSEQGTPEIAVAKLAGEFMEIVAAQVADVIECGRDPNIVTRAVSYLTYTHVAPVGVDAKWWLTELLTCLVELAVPSMILTPESSAFLLDAQEGIAESLGPRED